MADFVVSLRLDADGRLVVRESKRAEDAVERFGRGTRRSGEAAQRAGRNVDHFGRDARQAGSAARRAASDTGSLGRELSSLRTVIGGIGLGLLVRSGVRAADSMTLLRGRMRLVVNEGTDFDALMDDIFDSAQRARVGLDAFGTIAFRIGRALKDNEELGGRFLEVTELLGKSAVVSGASTQEMNAALIQLSQGLASGQLRGEELRSVMEQIPDVASRAAAGLGLTTAEFRELSLEGKISAEQFIEAFLSQAEQLERDFASVPRTVGQAVEQLTNEIQFVIGEQNRATGATGELTEAIDRLREAVGDAAPVIGSIAGALANITALAVENLDVIKSLIAAFVSYRIGLVAATAVTRTATAAFGLLNGAVRANPIGLLITTLGVAAGAMGFFATRTDAATRRLREQNRETRELRDEIDALNERLRRGEELTSGEETARQRVIGSDLQRQEAFLQRLEQRQQRAQTQLALAQRVGDEDTVIELERRLERLDSQAEEARASIGRMRNELEGIFQDGGETRDFFTGLTEDIEGLVEGLGMVRGVEAGNALAQAFATQREAVDGLLATLDPAIAAEQQFTTVQADLVQAFSLGEISLAEFNQRLDAQRRELLPSAAEAQADFNARLAEEIEVLGLSETAQRARALAQEEINRQIAAGIELSEDDKEAIRSTAEAHLDAVDAVEARKEAEQQAAQEVADIWEDAREQIQQSFADFLDSLFAGDLDSVEDFADAVVGTLRRGLAEEITAGLFSGQAMRGGGGFFGQGGILGLFGTQQPANSNEPLNVAISDGGPLTGLFDDARRGIDRLGESLGFSSSEPLTFVPGEDGPQAVFGAGQSLSGALGSALGAGAGGLAAGSIVADIIPGLGDTGASLGGAGGAIIGSLVPGIGTAIGAIAGGLLGGVLGGLFGDSTPNARVFLGGAGGRANIARVTTPEGNNAEIAAQTRQLGDVLTQAINAVVGLGGEFQGGLEAFLEVEPGKKNPFRVRIGGTPGNRAFDETFKTADEAIQFFLQESVREGLLNVPETVNTVLRNSTATDTQGLLEDLAFIETFDALVGLGRGIPDTVERIKELNGQFLDAIDRANELGLAEEQLAAARERVLADIAGEVDRANELAILELTDPIRAALEAQQDRARQILLDAAAAGADIEQARRRVELERQALIAELENSAAQATSAFRREIDDLLDSIRFGDRSGLAAQERLPVLLERFNALVGRAADDPSARDALPQAARDLLDVAGETFASSAAFFDLQARVATALEQIPNLQVDAPDVRAIAEEVGRIEQDPEFQRLMEDIGQELADSNAQVIDLLAQIRNGIVGAPGNDNLAPPFNGGGFGFGGGFGGSIFRQVNIV